jgi:hypothetical protein
VHIGERYQSLLQVRKYPDAADHDEVLCLSSERLLLGAQLGPPNLGFPVSSLPNVVLQIYRPNCGVRPCGSFLLMASGEGGTERKTSGAVRVLDQSRNAREARGVAD